MEGTLQLVLDKQSEFQQKLGTAEQGADIKEMSALVHTHSQFAVEEIFEMLRELPYHKPWKDYSGLTLEETLEKIDAAQNEWIDVFIFVMNVALFLGFDENLIKTKYLEKLGINHKRQEDPELGYVKGDA